MIETKRLVIKPLTYEQLIKYIRLDNSLEKELNLNRSNRTISPELREALEKTILPAVADKNKNYLYNTLWTIISKEDGKMVGDLCFTGDPDAAGEIEIGYGTYEIFRRRGYMAEAVGGIINWAKNQPDIRSILASTEKSNIASYSVLEKNSFIKLGETETLFQWKLNLKIQ